MPCLSIDVPVEVFVFQRGGAPDKPFKWTYNLFWGLTEQQTVEWDMFTQVDDQQEDRRHVAEQRARQRVPAGVRRQQGLAGQGLHVRRRRPLRAAERGLHQADQPVQEGRLRDHAGRHDRPRLDHLHQAVRAAGLQAQDHGGDHPHPVPDQHGVLRQRWPTVSAACSGSIPPSRSSRRSPARPARRCATTSRRSRACSGSRPSCTTPSSNGLSTCFKRTTNIDDKEEFIKRVQETKMADSLAGPIDFTVPVQWGTSHPTLNCVTTPTLRWPVAALERWQVHVRPGGRQQRHHPGRRRCRTS